MPWHDDPDELAGELNSLVPAAAATPAPDTSRLEVWLRTLIDRKGADLLLVAGGPPAVRIDGQVVRLNEPVLDGDEIDQAVRPALPAYAQQRYDESGIADASLKVPGLGRFRINLHHERRHAAATIRALPTRVPQARQPEPARKRRTALPHPARPGRHRRRHRLGQDDDARGAGRRNQPARSSPHRHHRRPDRVRTRPRSLGGRTGGDWHRCAGLPDGAPRGRPPGPGRHRRRRDARPGDDADRAGGGADRAPRADDDAHDRRGGHRGSNRGQLPAGAAADHPAGSGDGIVGGVDPVAAASESAAGVSPRPNC